MHHLPVIILLSIDRKYTEREPINVRCFKSKYSSWIIDVFIVHILHEMKNSLEKGNRGWKIDVGKESGLQDDPSRDETCDWITLFCDDARSVFHFPFLTNLRRILNRTKTIKCDKVKGGRERERLSKEEHGWQVGSGHQSCLPYHSIYLSLCLFLDSESGAESRFSALQIWVWFIAFFPLLFSILFSLNLSLSQTSFISQLLLSLN